MQSRAVCLRLRRSDLFEHIARMCVCICSVLPVSASCRSTNAEGRRTKTTLLVTHRFNTVRRADKIAVFEKGSIKEIGTHQELMQIEGGIKLLHAFPLTMRLAQEASTENSIIFRRPPLLIRHPHAAEAPRHRGLVPPFATSRAFCTLVAQQQQQHTFVQERPFSPLSF
jgi:ABC-type multidrug transport system ATPase subunit